jgi:hypothetical protein
MKVWFRLNLLLVFTVLPVLLMYINADPTVHLVKLIFQALPIIPLNSVSRILLPLILMLTRYILIVLFSFELVRMYCLGALSMLIFISQLQDAFDYQVEVFKKSRSNMRQISLAYVLKYREILIIRDTFNPLLSFGPFVFLFCMIPIILLMIYSVVKMYHDMPTVNLVMFIYLICASIFIFKTVIKEAAAIEEASVEILGNFQIETRRLHGRDLRYVSKSLKSLPVCSLYIGLPGFNIVKAGNSATTSAFCFVLDNTITLLLTF